MGHTIRNIYVLGVGVMVMDGDGDGGGDGGFGITAITTPRIQK